MSPPDDKSSLLNAWFTRLDDGKKPLILGGRFKIFFLCLLLLALLLLNLITSNFHYWINGLAILAVILLFWSIGRVLLLPILQLCDWADSMRAVNLEAQVKFDSSSDFDELARDINMLGNMINQLSLNTEAQLEKHTAYISRESRSLLILYDVASSINLSKDLSELFQKSLTSLCNNLNADAGIVRQIKSTKNHEIAASVGSLNHTFIASVDRFLPLQQSSDNIHKINRVDTLAYSAVFANAEVHSDHSLTVFSIPVPYRNATLGVIHLFFAGDIGLGIGDYDELLLSIGQHLGTAVEKFRLLEEENELLIMQERTHLSHELHDSLAQTLASLRIQLRVIGDSITASDSKSSKHEMEKIEFTMEQANNQVRELIAHFRAPVNQQDLISSIEDTIQRCREDTGISIYFQCEWPPQELAADVELNLLRIVQEVLANVRKHSQAKIVRVSLTNRNGQLSLLIEDDGIGFDEYHISPERGQHLGLNILRDRAQQINGTITIDSEPGEGTRISLQFNLEIQE